MTIALDLDGTLVTCEPRQSAVLRAALVACQQRANVNLIWSMKREGASTLSALCQCGLPTDSASQVAEYWQRTVEDPHWLGLDTVLPGVLESLSAWRTHGITLVLLTARNRPEWVTNQLYHLGLAKFFTQVNCVPPKSAATAKARFLRELNPLAFVGDTESDANAAKLSHCRFVAISSGQRSAAFLKAAKIDECYSEFSSLHDFPHRT